MLSELYELRGLIVNNLDRMENMTFDKHIQMLVSHGDVVHTVDRGWLKTTSDVLDTVGIVSLVGWITGGNFLTRQRLTDAERSKAGVNALTNVGFFALGVMTGGKGTLAAKAVANIKTSMLSGASSVATAGLLDRVGAPPWLQTVGSMATGNATGNVSGRVINARDKARVAGEFGDLARENGLTADQLSDIKRQLPNRLFHPATKNT